MLPWAVVNDHVLSEPREFPERSFTPRVILTVYWVPYNRFESGSKVAVDPLPLTMPSTGSPSAVLVTRKVAGVTVAALMAVLKVAWICVLTATPVAPCEGALEMMLRVSPEGGVVLVEVVNDHAYSDARALPALSFTPVVTRAV
jgi:hypothetical protein